ncbi:uncharacterized protein LOC143294539 isoform X1 [Babylonia areolata]|uniref:uncharacterized protein LOC143294539 isoform X1 n=1 Tax=Babylonia areolata TaxID=304850 RepID=UPI003FD4C69D
MYVPVSVEEELRAPRSRISSQPGSGQWWACMYLSVFTSMYGLSFVMPFWPDVPLDSSHEARQGSDGMHVHGADNFTSAGNRSRLRSFSDVWKYSWEVTGFAVRCLTLLVLVIGCVVSVCRLCWVTSGPARLPALCGILAGVLGIYGELVLWLGVYLLAPNRALTQSQVFCSLTALFCLVIGLLCYRYKVSGHGGPPSPLLNLPHRCPVLHDFDHLAALRARDDSTDLRSDSSSFSDTAQRRSVGTTTEDNPLHAAAGPDRDGTRSDRSEDGEVGRPRHKALATYVSAETCAPEDLPDDLRRPAEEGAQRDNLPQPLSPPLVGAELGPRKDLPEDLRRLLPDQDVRCGAELIQGGDFDHRAQFIDDDLYYHSSDDDQLERYIRPDSLLHMQPSQLSVESRTSASSTARLLHTETALLLPFGDSEEFHSLSDDDSYKNKTWP